MNRIRPLSSLRRAVVGLSLAAALVASMAFPASASAGCPGADADPNDVRLAKARAATLCLVNAQRERRGIRPLRGDSKLREAATGHSLKMAKRNFFSHLSLNGDSVSDRIRATGYLAGARSWAVGENIGWGSGVMATPRRMVRAWMQSPPHKEALLSRKFRDIGVGVARGAPVSGITGGATYTTDFGRR